MSYSSPPPPLGTLLATTDPSPCNCLIPPPPPPSPQRRSPIRLERSWRYLSYPFPINSVTWIREKYTQGQAAQHPIWLPDVSTSCNFSNEVIALFETPKCYKMFIGSLVASRFLGLIAHFVVTVVIFLSKVGFFPNRRSSVMFMFGCLLHEFTVIYIIPWLLMIRLGIISSNHFQDANVKACLPIQYTESEFSSKDKE